MLFAIGCHYPDCPKHGVVTCEDWGLVYVRIPEGVSVIPPSPGWVVLDELDEIDNGNSWTVHCFRCVE